MKDLLAAERAALTEREQALKAELAPLEERRNEIGLELAGIDHSSQLLDYLLVKVEQTEAVPGE